ncbi:hypothetical protein VB773_08150 [Haloarculaceae archaeon H-GB2-1]|nr:hypothetical protein [Haloarculaceae archaeon H-GB2-1]
MSPPRRLCRKPVDDVDTTTESEPCTTDTLLTDAGTDELTPRPVPERPATLSRESVRAYAESYERAFTHNHELGRDVRAISVEILSNRVEQVRDGFSVRLSVHVTTRASAAETPTVVAHSDVRYDAHYFVSEHVLRRTETPGDSPPPSDPSLRTSSLTLACWP